MIRKIEVSSKVIDGSWRLHKDHPLNGSTVPETIVNRPTQEYIGNTARVEAQRIIRSYDTITTIHTVLSTARAAEDIIDIRRAGKYAERESAEFMRTSMLHAAEHQVAGASAVTPITRFSSITGITDTSMFGERSNYIKAKSYEKALVNAVGVETFKQSSIPYNQLFVEALRGNINLQQCLDSGTIGGIAIDNLDPKVREAFIALDHLATENRMGALFDNGNLSELAESATSTHGEAKKLAEELNKSGYMDASGKEIDFIQMTHSDFATFDPGSVKMDVEDAKKFYALKGLNGEQYLKILDTASSFSCDRTSLSDVTRQIDAYTMALNANFSVALQKMSVEELRDFQTKHTMSASQISSFETLIGLRDTQNKLDHQYSPLSAKMQAKIANTDFSDKDSVEKLRKAFIRYGRLHAVSGLNDGFDFTNASEAENVIAIALSMKDPKHLERQIKSLENTVRLAIGKEKLDASGLNNEIFGMIATGQIDVDAILDSGTFCGKDISKDTEFLDAITALKMYATAASINEEQSRKVIEALLKRSAACHDIDTLALCKYFDKLQADGQIDIEAALSDSLKELQRKNVIKSLDELKGMSFKDMPIEVIQAIDVKKLTEKLPRTTQKEIARAEMIEKRLEQQLKPQLERNQAKAEKLNRKLNLDLNNIKSVRAHTVRLASALNLSSKNGVEWIRRNSKFKDFKGADIRTLKKLLNSKAGKALSAEEIAGIKSLIGYKQHIETLNAKNKFRRNTRMRLKRGIMHYTGLGQADLVKGVQMSKRIVATTRQVLRAARALGRMAYKPFKPLVMFMTRNVRMRFNSNVEAAKNLVSRLKATVKAEMQEIAGKAKDAARKALEKLKNKFAQSNPKAAAALSKVSQKFKYKREKKQARKAAKRKKKELAAGKKNVILGAFNAAKALTIKIAVIVIFCILGSYFAGVALQAILTPLEKLDDMFSAISNFHWFWEPKEATAEQKAALLPSVIMLLKDEESESNTVSYWIEQYDMSGSAFYSWVDPITGKKTKLSPARELTDEDLLTPVTTRFYNEIGPDGRVYAGTQYSTIKLVVSMAHAFTLPVQTEDDLDVFQEYCIGLWHYINEYSLAGQLECTPESTKSVRYSCAKSTGSESLHSVFYERSYTTMDYGDIVTEYLSKSTDDTINDNSSRYIVVGNGPVAETENGCQYRRNNALTFTANTYYTDGNGYINSTKIKAGKLSSYSTKSSYYSSFLSDLSKSDNPFRQQYIVTVQHPTETGTEYYANYVYYAIDPIIAEECAHNEYKSITDGNGKKTTEKTTAAGKLLSGTTFCSTTEHCTNTTVIYCDGCQFSDTTYCSDASQTIYVDGAKIEHIGPSDCGCDNCEHLTAYRCNGHITTAFCNGYNLSVTDINGFTINNVAKEPICSHAQSVTVKIAPYRSIVYFYCSGYEKTVYCFSNYTGIKPQSCTSYTTEEFCVCHGHCEATCPGHTVCLGHCTESACDKHYYCPGHTLSYSTGELKYQITKTILAGGDISELDSPLYKDWDYEYNLLLSRRFFDFQDRIKHVRSSSKELAGKLSNPFTGWDEDTVMLMMAVFEGDWYGDYGALFSYGNSSTGYGSGFWEGGTVSDSERMDIFTEFNIGTKNVSEDRINVITAALASVGNVPYQPGGVVSPTATDYSIAALGFGDGIAPTEYITQNGVCYRIKGLDGFALADYVLFSMQGNRSTNLVPVKNENLIYELPQQEQDELLKISDFDNIKPGDILLHYIYDANGKKVYNDSRIVVGVKKNGTSTGTIYKLRTVGMGTYWAELQNMEFTSYDKIQPGWNILRGVYS